MSPARRRLDRRHVTSTYRFDRHIVCSARNRRCFIRVHCGMNVNPWRAYGIRDMFITVSKSIRHLHHISRLIPSILRYAQGIVGYCLPVLDRPICHRYAPLSLSNTHSLLCMDHEMPHGGLHSLLRVPYTTF